VEAVVAERPDPRKLPADEAAAERAIRQALAEPGSVAALPAAKRPPAPVALWLYPAPVAIDRRQSEPPPPRPSAPRAARPRTPPTAAARPSARTCPTARTA
jgi:nitric oxide reductase NorD protein